MGLSSSALFHFTRNYETLRLILESLSFWPRYCVEYGWNISFAVPMSCFCDIPLSQISNHIGFYGCYGIGLSKDWALKNGQINPAFYVTKEFLLYFNLLVKENGLSNQEKVRKVMSRIKPYIGKNQRTESDGSIRYYEDYNYYNEREWRYVPDKLDFKKQCIKIGKNGELCETLHENTNNDDCRLKFSCDDIKYLFVESEEERLQLIKFLDSKFEDKITAMQLILLKSRILTKEQLEHDI